MPGHVSLNVEGRERFELPRILDATSDLEADALPVEATNPLLEIETAAIAAGVASSPLRNPLRDVKANPPIVGSFVELPCQGHYAQNDNYRYTE